MMNKRKSEPETDELVCLRRRVAELEAGLAAARQEADALRRDVDRYRVLAENTNDILYSMDAEGRLTYVGPQVERYGFKAEEVIARRFLEFVDPADRQRVEDEFRRSISTGQEFITEFRALDKEGRLIWFEDYGRTRRDGQGEIVALVGVLRDVTERKRMIEALEESEEKYRLLFDSAPVGIGIADLDGKVLDANRSMQELTGYDLEEFKGLDIATVYFDPHDREKLVEALRKSGSVRDFEVALRRKDGELYWALLNVDVTEIGGRKVLLTTARDVSGQRFARTLQQFQRGIINNTLAGIVVVRVRDGAIVHVNPRSREMFGYSAEELRGMHVSMLNAPTPDKSPGQVAEAITAELLEHGSWAGEVETVRKDGARFWCQMAVSRLVSPWHGDVWAGILIDVTQCRQAEQRLLESEAKYRAIVEHVPVITYTAAIDEKSTTLYISPQTEKLLAFTQEEYAANPDIWRQSLHPDDRQRVMDEVSRAHATGEPLRSEYRMIRRDGQVVWFRDEGSIVKGEGGEPPLLQGVMFDISARKRAEEEVREAQAKLVRAREDERRRLAAELHDSVGQSLIGLQLLVKGIIAGEQGADAEKLKRCNEVAERCAWLVEEVRHIGYGIYPPTLESLGLVPSLRELAALCEKGGKTAEVTCDAAVEKARLTSDVEVAFYRIAQEAVNNAMRHSEAERVCIELDYRDARAVLSVTDDGVGFEAASAGGKGLGLNSMEERARAIGGELEITSGGGRTCVKVSAPAELRG